MIYITSLQAFKIRHLRLEAFSLRETPDKYEVITGNESDFILLFVPFENSVLDLFNSSFKEEILVVSESKDSTNKFWQQSFNSNSWKIQLTS